jgi:hypothetical protein
MAAGSTIVFFPEGANVSTTNTSAQCRSVTSWTFGWALH